MRGNALGLYQFICSIIEGIWVDTWSKYKGKIANLLPFWYTMLIYWIVLNNVISLIKNNIDVYLGIIVTSLFVFPKSQYWLIPGEGTKLKRWQGSIVGQFCVVRVPVPVRPQNICILIILLLHWDFWKLQLRKIHCFHFVY